MVFSRGNTMLLTIIIREIQEYIKSRKFLIGLLTTIILVVLSTVINTADYVNRNQDYIEVKKNGVISRTIRNVYKSPQVLSILVQGKDRKLGNSVYIRTDNIPAQTTNYIGRQGFLQKWESGLITIDYAFVVKIVLSLFVIFLSYNSICEEKTQGTLRLIFSNTIPRHTILIGKLIGGSAVIFVSLAIATLFSLLIMVFHPLIAITSSDWFRIAGIFSVSALYLILFFTLSLFVSVKINKPSSALIILLQVWLIITIIYPNAGLFIADTSERLPTQLERAQKKMEIIKSLSDRRLSANEQSTNWAEGAYQYDRMFNNELSRQAQKAINYTLLSPGVLLDLILSRYAKTGIDEHEKFLDSIYQYWLNYFHYTKIDESDTVPEFSYRSESLSTNTKASLNYIIILFLMSILFFMLAYTSFLRKDVR